jgi:hypothetical protein
MRSVVAANNVYRWAGKILLTLSKLDPEEAPSIPPPSESRILAGVAQ